MAVYNLGVFVRNYPGYQVGSGGKVVTKPGVRLAVNMARNDILLTECKVWKRIKPFLQKVSDKRVKDTTRKVSPMELDNIATRFLSNDVTKEEVLATKLIEDISGKTYCFSTFFKKVASMPVITGDKNSQVLDRVNQLGLAFVMSEDTLARFGVATVSELGELICSLSAKNRFNEHPLTIQKIKWMDDASAITASLSNDHMTLHTKDLTKEEQLILRAINQCVPHIFQWYLSEDNTNTTRRIVAGVSDVALAWTDAVSTITIERRQLKLARQGLSGMQVLINLLVHEYCHEVSSAGSHMHDFAFYEKFHKLLVQPGFSENIALASQYAFKAMVKLFTEHNVKVIRSMKEGIDLLHLSKDMHTPEFVIPMVDSRQGKTVLHSV